MHKVRWLLLYVVLMVGMMSFCAERKQITDVVQNYAVRQFTKHELEETISSFFGPVEGPPFYHSMLLKIERNCVDRENKRSLLLCVLEGIVTHRETGKRFTVCCIPSPSGEDRYRLVPCVD